MPDTNETPPVAALASPAGTALCPGCGAPVEPGGRGYGKTFHDDACRRKFHSVHVSEGQPLAPLAKAWHATRHAAPGTREADICRWARGQITQIVGTFLERDEEEGRDVVAYVGSLMDSGIQFVDRRAWRGK